MKYKIDGTKRIQRFIFNYPLVCTWSIVEDEMGLATTETLDTIVFHQTTLRTTVKHTIFTQDQNKLTLRAFLASDRDRSVPKTRTLPLPSHHLV